MARIAIASPADVPSRSVAQRIRDAIREAGHDDAPVGNNLGAAAEDSDALIALASSGHGPAQAAPHVWRAAGKPVLLLASTEGGPRVDGATTCTGATVDEWLAALPAFFEEVRPFAGRVVRDRIPHLVKEAGHSVTFRQLTAEERPRFLKQKVLQEARELLGAAAGEEKEEIADLLEALEAFLLARGYDRASLKAVKEGKRKRRGGFENGWVVEESAAKESPPRVSAESAPPASKPEGRRPAPEPADGASEDPEDAQTARLFEL